MKVVSLVPSWTETLIEWGVPVVGRTRYCIHPAAKIAEIAALGGTKNPNWQRIHQLSPDVVVVDREENNQDVLEKSQVPLLISHVESVQSMPREYQKFADFFGERGEGEVAKKILLEQKLWQELTVPFSLPVEGMPGVLEWLQRPTGPIKKIIYLIWKDPWMAVGPKTFIGSMFSLMGFQEQFFKSPEKYPKIVLEDHVDDQTLLLFSSEPYPFAKEKERLLKLPCPAAIVDGECFSWFGHRSLKFLSSLQNINN